ncbi:two-component sensor histidine kinase [Rhizobium leguminosarum]|uniref:sensor histidine kinase n=1 Tax=Rhizobium ruizarguesonis TaxID=2081791 RepID=UPI0013DECD92|nr:ATP-binding protein [Rhizobium ruizarguesonis]NEJ26902.1 two-component sensor histidine kinase [Rhizobium ruizarguesonis]
MTSAHFFNGRTDNGHSTVLAAVALALAGTIFYIDTFTNIEGAIAVLYVIALLLLGDILTPRGHVTACVAAVGLAAASYVYAHSDALIDLQSLLRLSVALAALVITTSLLMRNEASRSELIATNAALRESESRYRAIFERTKVALWERDYSAVREILFSLKAQGVDDIREYARQQPEIVDRCVAAVRTVAANEAAVELLGRNAIDQTPGSLRRILPPGDETFLDLMEAIFLGRRSFSDSVTVVGDDGERKLVLLTVSFPEDATAFNRVVTGMVDITQRELAQKALQDARAELAASSRTAAIGALSTSLAHELNQPLGAIIVSAQTLVRWLDRDPPDLAAARRATDRIVRDGERASEIIKQTRSRIEQTQSEPTSVDLVHLVEETCAIMDAEFDGHRVKHKIITSKSVPQVIAMRIELQQVLINLVTNAIQALANSRQANPQVNIEVRPGDGDQVVISVADNGPGIAEDAVDKLFAPFFTTKETGMGIGLSVSKTFVEAIGGRLTARNNASGGAVFELSLPLVGAKKHETQYA